MKHLLWAPSHRWTPWFHPAPHTSSPSLADHAWHFCEQTHSTVRRLPPTTTTRGTAAAELPRLLHPSLQADVPAGLFDLQRRGAGLLSAQGLREVRGVLGGQPAGGRETRGALGVTQGVALYNKTRLHSEEAGSPDSARQRHSPRHVAACRPKCAVSRHTAHLAALMLRPTVKR